MVGNGKVRSAIVTSGHDTRTDFDESPLLSGLMYRQPGAPYEIARVDQTGYKTGQRLHTVPDSILRTFVYRLVLYKVY
jgi:hypothetical protein